MGKSYSYSIIVDEINVEAIKGMVISTYAKELIKTQRAVEGASQVCKRVTKAKCPVGTAKSTGKKNYKGGTLKASYTQISGIGGLESAVYTDVPYGKFVELSTYKMAAQPHLYPGFLEGAAYLMAAMGVQL